LGLLESLIDCLRHVEMLLWGLVEVLVGVVFFGRRSEWLEMAIHLQGVFLVLVLVVVLVVVVVRGWFYSNGS